MDVEDLILISVDDHVVEPSTMFDAHVHFDGTLSATLAAQAGKGNAG